MKKYILPILLLITQIGFSQNWPVKQLVTDKKAAGKTFLQIPAFRFMGSKQLAQRGTYQELQLDAAFTRQIMAQRPEALSITIPLSATETLTCELVKASLGNSKFTENNSKVIPKVRIPVLYRGIVTGEQQKNTVVLTVNDDYLSLVATFPNKAIQITQADTASPAIYRLYNSADVQFPAGKLNCGTQGTDAVQIVGGIPLNGTYNKNNTVQDKCVNVYVDCFDSLYLHFSNSRQQTINYVHELFNLVTTGFLNDTVNIQVIGINIWTTTDPFRQDSSRIALNDLGFYYQDNFWGNICVGLDWGDNRGGLAWVGKAKAVTPNSCSVYRATDSAGAFSYCDLNFDGEFLDFPTGPHTTQGQVYVTMHEMGHSLGSEHTHWCGWQLTATTTGPIDNCAPIDVGPNGSCAPGPRPPATGGTIMSYCHQFAASSFIGYNNGFGPLPGNAIRNFVSNTSCIPNCQACPAEGLGIKKPDNHLMSPAPVQVWGRQQRTPLSPDTRQRFFAAPATTTTVSAYTATHFRKPKEPAVPFAASISTK